MIAEGLHVQEFQVLSLMAGGNQVAVEFVIAARLKKGDGGYRDEEMHLWTFGDDGKVVEAPPLPRYGEARGGRATRG